MWEWLAGLLGDKGVLLQSRQYWQDHPVMEADLLWPSRARFGISGLWSSSRGLAVLDTALCVWGCSPSSEWAGQCRENP